MSEPALISSSPSTAAAVTADQAGWDYVSFRVDRLASGARLVRETDADEVALIPLSGRVEIRTDDDRWEAGGRAGVFDGLAHALYLPRGRSYQVCPLDGDVELATCAARAEEDHPPRLVNPGEYQVVTRGSGNATRQVATVLPPEFPAHRLLVVEVWTPAGNWSSYPPHKHDELRPPNEQPLEETYYYRLAGAGGFAVQRLYCPRRGVDLTWALQDGDLLTIPWGYHTTAAVPGYHLYYLNVLAGPSRELSAAEDPDHAWVRESWNDERADPRVPLVA